MSPSVFHIISPRIKLLQYQLKHQYSMRLMLSLDDTLSPHCRRTSRIATLALVFVLAAVGWLRTAVIPQRGCAWLRSYTSTCTADTCLDVQLPRTSTQSSMAESTRSWSFTRRGAVRSCSVLENAGKDDILRLVDYTLQSNASLNNRYGCMQATASA